MTEQYQVHITRYAYKQMKEIRQYIEHELLSPDAAKALLVSIRKVVSNLAFMPAKYQLVEEEPWHTEGVRRVIVRNFLVYYFIDEEKKKVYVTAVVYGKREQLKQLVDMKMGDDDVIFSK